MNAPTSVRAGFTLVELLLAVAISGIIMATVAGFFVTQSRITRDQQIRSELQTAARLIGDIVAQDFQLVGSRAAASPNGLGVAANAVAANVNLGTFSCFQQTPDCLEISVDGDVDVGESASAVVTWGMYYMSSLWLSEPLVSGASGNFNQQLSLACRRVEYMFRDALILRSDVSCLATSPNLASVDPFGYEVAAGVELVSLSFICAGDSAARQAVGTPEECFDSGGLASFVRSVEIGIRLSSTRDANQVLTYQIAAPTPNLRPPFSLIDGL